MSPLTWNTATDDERDCVRAILQLHYKCRFEKTLMKMQRRHWTIVRPDPKCPVPRTKLRKLSVFETVLAEAYNAATKRPDPPLGGLLAADQSSTDSEPNADFIHNANSESGSEPEPIATNSYNHWHKFLTWPSDLPRCDAYGKPFPEYVRYMNQVDEV